MSPAKRRYTPYQDKPRSFRRDRFVSLRWKIAQDPNGRGVFTSKHMLNGGVYDGQVYEAPGDSHWNDLRFLSKKHAQEGRVYTATVRTALLAALDWAENFAWEKEQATLTPEEYALAHPPLEFVPAGRGLYELKSHPEAVFHRFGPTPITAWGLRSRFLREAFEQIPPIHPQCTLDRNYKTGLGAHFIVDQPFLTIDRLADLVHAFWERGEVPYQDAPVDFSPRHPENHQALRQMIDAVAQHWDKMDQRVQYPSSLD